MVSQAIDALSFLHVQAMLHDVGFNERQCRARLKRKHVDCHVEARIAYRRRDARLRSQVADAGRLEFGRRRVEQRIFGDALTRDHATEARRTSW